MLERGWWWRLFLVVALCAIAAYLHHLFSSGELLVYRLATTHNLHHYQTLMAGARAAIEAGTFDRFRRGVDSGVGSPEALG